MELGQRPTDGTPRDVPHCPYVPWGLRDGMNNWDRGLQMGFHGMSPPYLNIPWGLRDGMDSWDRGLYRWDSVEYPLTVHTSLGD